MAQAPVARPLGEAHLRDQARLDPGRARDALGVRERAPGADEGAEAPAQVACDRRPEAGADLAGVLERPDASYTPTSRAPIPSRAPFGSVNPPITSSCSRTHFTFSQSVDRPSR